MELTLREKRVKLTSMIAKIIMFAEAMGYEVALDSCKACHDCKGHRPFSNHKHGLAVDLNLYLNGEYLDDGTGHDKLHDIFDKMGGAERIPGDLNHYSLYHQGRR